MAVMVNESFRPRANRENFAGRKVNRVQIAARADRSRAVNSLISRSN
jgi:hypothetical protein